ncbi:MAG: alanine racemase [Bernardetiaceae bacterium]|nr:alanine racemase [Bernardetiaceae bacterium]
MAHLVLYRERLKQNYEYLDNLLSSQDISWGVVSKLLCGNEIYLRELLDMGVTEIMDSRISNLKIIKEMNPEVRTGYIKPPAKGAIPDVVRYADVSFNSELDTIKLLSEEAQRQDKVHRVIIMIEMGDLREGVMRDDLVDFYAQIFEQPNIEVAGLGTNLNCLHGVMPSEDKLIQLCLYKQIIELKFKRDIPLISAGTSVVLPLIYRKIIPKEINHFRIGETLFFGTNLFDNTIIEGMNGDVLELFAEVIEVSKKPVVPMGEMAANPSGEVFVVDEEDYGRTSHRAIIDIGLLDIKPEFLIPKDENLEVVGASSDMLVIDLKDNPNQVKVGDVISFNLKYMGALSIFNSNYIEKRIV